MEVSTQRSINASAKRPGGLEPQCSSKGSGSSRSRGMIVVIVVSMDVVVDVAQAGRGAAYMSARYRQRRQAEVVKHVLSSYTVLT